MSEPRLDATTVTIGVAQLATWIWAIVTVDVVTLPWTWGIRIVGGEADRPVSDS